MSETGFAGPTFKELISSNNPRIYTMWAVVWTFNLATMYIGLKYRWRMLRTLSKTHQPMRLFYFHVARMPAIWAVTTGLSVIFTRFYYIMNIFEKVYEVLAIMALAKIFVEMSGGYGRMVYVLNKLEPQNWRRRQPCCCLGFHGQPYKFDLATLTKAMKLCKQSFLLVILAYTIQVFLVVMNSHVNTKVLTILGLIASISVVSAMYGANILRGALDELPYMHSYKLLQKFMVVQSLVVLGVVQSFIIQLIVKAAGVNGAEPYNEDSGVMEIVWANSILAIEAPFIMYMSVKAFPPEEIVDFYRKVDAYLPKEEQQHLLTSSEKAVDNPNGDSGIGSNNYDGAQAEEGGGRASINGVKALVMDEAARASTFIGDGAPEGMEDPIERKYWEEFALARLHRNRAAGVIPMPFVVSIYNA